jgi:hypothetical protein
MTTKECQDAAAALKYVFQSTEVGELYSEELYAAKNAHQVRRPRGPGPSLWGAIGKIVYRVIFDVSCVFTNPLFLLFVSTVGLHYRCTLLLRALLETMLKPMLDLLPTGVEYVRVIGQPLKVKDTQPWSERDCPGQDVTSLTVLNPALAQKLVHPFIMLAHLFLVASLEDKMDDLFLGGEGKENGKENVAALINEPLRLFTEDKKRDQHCKILIRRHTSLECVCWHLISDMYGFGLDGSYKQICESAERQNSNARVDPLVRDTIFKLYPVIFG